MLTRDFRTFSVSLQYKYPVQVSGKTTAARDRDSRASHKIQEKVVQHTSSAGLAMTSFNDEAKVYVGNLPRDIRSSDIEDLFYKFGKIVEVDLHTYRDKDPFAFVEFDDKRFVNSVVWVGLRVFCNK